MQPIRGAPRLRELLRSSELSIAPGVYDGLSARVAAQEGANVLYASGGAIARATGFPDLGPLAMTEMRDRIAEICTTAQVPVIADADTGYGNALNVVRTVHEFTRAGAAAIHIEDHVAPKRCGHYAGKALISAAAMRDKIRAALDSRDPDELARNRTHRHQYGHGHGRRAAPR
jgi:2-methylisocitrate lyase-like PEP mutase family enzyme